MTYFGRNLGRVAGVLLAVCLSAAVADDLASRLGAGDAGNTMAVVEDPLAAITASLGDPVMISARVEPGSNGQPDQVAVTAMLEDGWHLYAITQKPGGPIATTIRIDPDSPRTPRGGFAPDSPPHGRTVDDVPAWKGLVIEEHSGTITWRAPLAPGSGDVRGAVRLQLCQDTTCLPPKEFPFTTGVAIPAATAITPSDGQSAVGRYTPDRTHASLVASTATQAGATVVRVEIVPEEGWHLYRTSDTGKSEVGQGKPTIVGGDASAVRAAVVKATPTIHPELIEAGAVDGPITLDITLDITLGADGGEALVGFQTCSDETCDPPSAVRLTVTAPNGIATFSEARYAEVAKAIVPLGAVGGGLLSGPECETPSLKTPAAGTPLPTVPTAPSTISLPLALLMGLAGGLLLNLMPCVLPVLGLKLMSFAQQSGRDRREVFQMNLWYCAGVFAVFMALATASVAANIGLGKANLAWGEQFTSAGFNITMIAIVFAFALSFLGVWELPIPGFIGEKAGHVQTQEGPVGSFLKGVLSTVLATPCSGPFLGPVFGFTLTQSTAVTYAVFGSIAMGMSLPYVMVGLIPGLVKVLPKPGAWMQTFKELLGFVMLGTVVYLFTFLHHEWFVPTLAMLVGLWGGCWWIGRGQETTGTVGFGRWVQAGLAAALVSWGAFSLLAPGESVIEWQQPFSRDRIVELRRSGATVMVDFSADWCPTCKFNLAYAIETDRVKQLVDANRVVPVLADWTDGSEEIKAALEGLQSRSIPVLAIYPAATAGGDCPEPIILRDLITESQVIAALEQAGPSNPGVMPVR